MNEGRQMEREREGGRGMKQEAKKEKYPTSAHPRSSATMKRMWGLWGCE